MYTCVWMFCACYYYCWRYTSYTYMPVPGQPAWLGTPFHILTVWMWLWPLSLLSLSAAALQIEEWHWILHHFLPGSMHCTVQGSWKTDNYISHAHDIVESILRDHLSWKTRYSWQKVPHFNVIELVTKDHLSWESTFANGVVFQNRFYCTLYSCTTAISS